eukprot:CFRG6503T1
MVSYIPSKGGFDSVHNGFLGRRFIAHRSIRQQVSAHDSSTSPRTEQTLLEGYQSMGVRLPGLLVFNDMPTSCEKS